MRVTLYDGNGVEVFVDDVIGLPVPPPFVRWGDDVYRLTQRDNYQARYRRLHPVNLRNHGFGTS